MTIIESDYDIQTLYEPPELRQIFTTFFTFDSKNPVTVRVGEWIHYLGYFYFPKSEWSLSQTHSLDNGTIQFIYKMSGDHTIKVGYQNVLV